MHKNEIELVKVKIFACRHLILKLYEPFTAVQYSLGNIFFIKYGT